MYLQSTGIRLFVVTIAATFMVAAAFGEEPNKATKISHEVVPHEIPDQTNEPVNRPLSYSPEWPEPPDTGAMIFRLFAGTVVVLGLCVVTLWFGKPWLQKLQTPGGGNPSFHVSATVALGNRAVLYLVKVGDNQIVAGTDASGLKSLIAMPASFKEVLDEQVSETDAVATPTSRVSAQTDSIDGLKE